MFPRILSRFQTRRALRTMHVTTRRHISYDITGNKVSLRDKDCLNLLDEAIMIKICMEKDAIEICRDIISKDKTCALAHILYIFESLRCFHKNDPYSSIMESFSVLEEQHVQKSLTAREAYFARAAVAYASQNFDDAANMIESSLLEKHHEKDALALRLLQDCYILSGDKENILSCIARNPQVSDEKHHLHGHIQAMLSFGCLENSRFAEAEEFASLSVSRTNGQDLWAIYTLVNTYMQTGRSSEAQSLLERHFMKHEESGSILLQYLRGSMFIQRGNYFGCLRMVSYMLESMEKFQTFPVESVLNVSVLLWSAKLCTSNEIIHTYAGMIADRYLSDPSKFSPSSRTPMLNLSLSMALALATPTPIELPVDYILGETAETDKVPSSTSRGFMDQFFSRFTASETPKPKETRPYPVKVLPSQTNFVQLFEKHVEDIESRGTDERESPYSMKRLRGLFPSICGVTSTFDLNSRTVEDLSRNSRSNIVAPISRVLRSFCEGGYEATAQELKLNRAAISRLGGHLSQRDILHRTLIEALIRSDSLDTAQLLLNERVALSPNDAQSWNRLVFIFQKQGHFDKAQSAAYTTWQLGIGQGGYGGPK